MHQIGYCTFTTLYNNYNTINNIGQSVIISHNTVPVLLSAQQ